MSIITTGTEQPEPSDPDRPTVSINSFQLSYESADDDVLRILTGGLRRVPAVVVALVVAIAVVLAMAGLLVSTTAVGASESEAKIRAVHFDIDHVEQQDDNLLSAQGAATPARYRSLVVEDRGIELGLQPLGGTVGVTVEQNHAATMAAELDGLRIGSVAPNFADSLAAAASSADLHGFVRLDQPGGGSTAHLDVTYARALNTGDYLLVQDLDGDSVIELTALNSEGAMLGAPITVGPSYQWNTGHGVGDSLSWASVVGIHRFGAGGEPVAVVRASSTTAEFKVVALGPTIGSSVAAAGVEPINNPIDETGADPVVVEVNVDAGSAVEVAQPADAAAPVSSTTDGTASGDAPPTPADAPAVLANVAPGDEPDGGQAAGEVADLAGAPIQPPTALALTGMMTEPWVLVIFAMGLIFIGYTVYAAFRQNARSDESRGHDQLDALGFD